jgi:hypothetical protein
MNIIDQLIFNALICNLSQKPFLRDLKKLNFKFNSIKDRPYLCLVNNQ